MNFDYSSKKINKEKEKSELLSDDDSNESQNGTP